MKNGIVSSWFEMKLLLGEILNKEPKQISFAEALSDEQLITFSKMIQRRLSHCPVDKIIGKKGFYKYDFVVNEDVLSPRSDSEILVESAISILKDISRAKILELGIGSGCLILSLLAELNDTFGVGIDISDKAIKIAETNAIRLDINKNRFKFYHKSWFDEDIIEHLQHAGMFDLIISNPPYIPTIEITSLDEEVKDYDPKIALDGGSDGLKDYHQILSIASQTLKNNGYIILEAGDIAQLQNIARMAKSYSLKNVNILKDLSGNERCIILKK